MLKLADGCLAYGPDARDYLILSGANKAEVHVVNNICNAAPFLSAKRIWQKKPFADMLYVGELSERKNVLNLVRGYRQAMRYYPELRLTLVGGGDLQSTLEESKQKHGLKGLKIMGEVPSTDVPRVMKEADFVILPSKYDLWPHVVMEAMASGLPVLCSRNAAVPPYIVRDGENGFFFCPDSDVEIVEAIGKMMKRKGK
jgi:glycosyltransferase involved in cell wall biosynthesis